MIELKISMTNVLNHSTYNLFLYFFTILLIKNIYSLIYMILFSINFSFDRTYWCYLCKNIYLYAKIFIDIIHISSTYRPDFIHISSTFHPDITHISPTYHPQIIHISTRNCPDIIHISSRYHPHIIHISIQMISPTYHLDITNPIQFFSSPHHHFSICNNLN